MTILFQGNRTIQAGLHDSSVLPVPQNIKQPGKSFELKVSMDWDVFPVGNTTIEIFLSFDGGNTFPRSASDTWPARVDEPKVPHTVFIGFSMGPNDNPTHAKYRTNAPSQFTTQVTIEGNSLP